MPRPQTTPGTGQDIREVVDDVASSVRLDTGCRVLEIGCGTGQLSVPLALRGVELVAVELGPAWPRSRGEILLASQVCGSR